MKKIRSLVHKIIWFFKNYHHINLNSKLLSTHFHGPLTYDTDGLTTSNNSDFKNDPLFKKAYNAAKSTNPWPGFTLQWRVYIICYYANHVKDLEGDFVECGVNTGAYARALIEYINFNSLKKTFYLFDTYEGLPDFLVSEAELIAGIDGYLGNHYKNVYEQVKETFKPFKTKIIKGVVPETLSQFIGDKVCFLSIDMNIVKPEIAAANFFWDKLVVGGVMVLDDYGFPMHINQKLAFDDFAKKHNQNILSLPTGQGILVKK